MTAETHHAKQSSESLDLRNLIETIPALVVCAQPDGFAEFANHACQEYAGCSSSAYSGFAIGVDRSHGPFRGFLPRKTTPRDLYRGSVIAKPL
jgi:hypothetical protein